MDDVQALTDGVTLGEIARRLQRVEDLLADNGGVFVRKEVFQAEQKATATRLDELEGRIGRMEDAQVWAMRLIVSAGVGLVVNILMTTLQLTKVFGR